VLLHAPFPIADALVAIDILLDNTFIVACASPSAIIDCVRPASVVPESPARNALRESWGAGGVSTTAEGNGGDAGDSPPQRRRREDARGSVRKLLRRRTKRTPVRSRFPPSGLSRYAQLAEAHAKLAAALAALLKAALSAAPMRQPVFE
jgi:hypothetical protein